MKPSTGVLDYTAAVDIIEDTEVPVSNNSFSVTVPEKSGSCIRVTKE